MVKITPVRILAIVIFLYSLVVMTGWIFDIDALTGILPNGISMQFITAFSFLFCSISVWFIDISVREVSEIPLLILPVTTLLILLVTITILAAGLFRVHTGITDLFVAGNVVQSAVPGMPSLPTMIGFVLFGLACSITIAGVANLVIRLRIIGIIVAVIGFIAVFGYTMQIPFLYYKFSAASTPMAFNTALVFILLGLDLVLIGKTQLNENKS